MVKQIFVSILALSIVGCAQAPINNNSAKSTVSEMRTYADKAHGLAMEQNKLINSGSKDFPLLMDNVKMAEIARGDSLTSCSQYKEVYQARMCVDIGDEIKHNNMMMGLSTGNYLAKNGKKDEAQSLYRMVIANCNSRSCATIAKQAEFGLEDLRK